MEGKLLIFAAPSGSGKSTIINYLLQNEDLNLHFSVSATTRSPRPGEVDGEHYHFITDEAFRAHIEAGDFIEYEEVYSGYRYGTLKSKVEDQLRKGENVVFDVDVKGGLSIKERFGERALAVFVMPPSIDVLRQRLLNRGTETPESVEKRLQRAGYEISFSKEFDYVLVNDDLETAIREVYGLISKFLGV